ncbi:motility protein A [Clostridium minihomine]|uniref:motility protein A n=1 Tax=Clostridium minihomine TaxID=2045012 RepID=UPI000C76CA52|nr:MotA/TolQ/ExbB proton channel family protein [Clostridium minihomine]
MDISAIIGVVIAFGSIIAGYLLEHGVLSALLLPSPFIIVFGGTCGAIILSFGFGEIVGAFKFFLSTVFTKNSPDPEKLIKKMGEMADACRKEGLLKLQTMLNDGDLNDDSYLPLKEGMILTLDMKPAEEIAAAMESDLETYTIKKNMEIEVFVAAGGFSPTLGIIGTVMGLVQVLSHMTDAASLMSAIAAAFLATLYGILFANLLFFPMANRMKADLKRQKVYREMMIEGICLIASGKSARDVENQLSLYYHVFKNGQKKYKEGINN